MSTSVKRILSLLSVVILTGCGSSPSVKNLSFSGDIYWTEEQIAYLISTNIGDTTPYNGNMSVSAPRGFLLSFQSSGFKEKKINIYRNEQLTDLEVSYTTTEDSFTFYNPMFNQKYFWNVSNIDNTYVSETASFEVKPLTIGPRNLYVDGVENFRDLGGWGHMVDGKYVTYMKQGMIYRSGRFNEDKKESVNVTISDDGLYEVNNHLKIKTEIDLRRSGNNEIGGLIVSVLSPDVKYVNLPMYYGGNNILTYKGSVSGDSYQYDNPKQIKKFFDLLADVNNYPINFHCSIGKDRTGCMAYLIEGLMGFDQDMMYRDYMFTNFANAGMCKLTDITDRYGETIDSYTGATLSEKTYNYLHEVIGVEVTKLDAIKNILGN